MKENIHIKDLKRSIWFSCTILFSLFLLMNSCADKSNYEFSEEYVKELYDKTFPVKDIDPNQDWKTTTLVRMNVTVYGDELETYKIKVYDNIPGDSIEANRLVMAEVENGKTAELSFDCPNAVDTLIVSRVDKHNRRLMQRVVVNDKSSVAKVVFGEAPSIANSLKADSRAFTQADNGVTVQSRQAPYTSQQISDMLSTALEVESDKAIGQSYGQLSKTNVYKLTKDGGSYKFVYDGSSVKNVLIVTTDWTPSSPVSINGNNLTVVIAGGGRFSGSMTITNGSNLVVLGNGRIDGNSTISITNASNGAVNYNGGVMDINSLTVTSGNGEFYNAGTLEMDKYTATNSGTTLVNMGHCEIEDLSATNANIENGCYMDIDGDCSVTNLVVGNGATLYCEKLNNNQRGNMTVYIEGML